MARRDLTEAEIAEAKRIARELAAGAYTDVNGRRAAGRLSDFVERLTGEVLALREREAHSRQIHDLEGEY